MEEFKVKLDTSKAKSVNIYKSAGVGSTIIGKVTDGSKTYTCTKTASGTSKWYYLQESDGWVIASNFKIATGTVTNVDKSKAEAQAPASLKLATEQSKTAAMNAALNIINTTGTTVSTMTSTGIQTTVLPAGTNAVSGYQDVDTSSLTYEPDLSNYDVGSTIESYMDFKQIKGVFGMPYQYPPSVDRRLTGTNDVMEYGRKFSEKILMNPPLLFITPGRPQFMAGFSKEYKQSVMQKLYEGGILNDDDLTNNEDGRYYTFKFAYDEYYTYVNQMCSTAATLLGIGDEKFDGVPLKRYNWANYKNDNLKSFISGNEYTCFYIEANTQISESFNNSTGDSSLASTINSLSDLGKEAAFLMGNAAGIELEASIRAGYQNNLEAFSNFFNKWGGNGASTVANKLFSGASALALGGHIAFPEIWKDSDNTQSYNITCKFASPDGDNVSIFLNELVPYYHLLGYVLPQALGYNCYTSPFLVRASYGGNFNCEMGIITSMDVDKGPTWNQFGLPTEITVQFTIKDLYQTMYMNNHSSASAFLKNTPFVDFIANSVGVNMCMPELGRQLQMYMAFNTNKYMNSMSNLKLNMSNFLSNSASKMSFLW